MLVCADSLEYLKEMPENSVDAVVTDPPYGLAFMGKRWDYDVPSVELWREVLRVLKPGGHLLSFFGTRTYHAGVSRIEEAGFEIRDMLSWIYGSGFPKSLDVSKAIDKAAGAERAKVPRVEVGGQMRKADCEHGWKNSSDNSLTFDKNAITDAAKAWQGFGTALKPACEPIVLARKPLSEKTVAENVLKWGCGAINVDAGRISVDENDPNKRRSTGGYNSGETLATVPNAPYNSTRDATLTQGRWPANVLLDEVTGCAEWARYFYIAKASKRERNAGLEGMPVRASSKMGAGIQSNVGNGKPGQTSSEDRRAQNHHPTVKPIKLMEYLCRLITQPGGIILDPFMGSGSTGVAAKRLGFQFIGIEKESEYVEIAKRRIKKERGDKIEKKAAP